MSDMSPVSGGKRKSKFGAVTSGFDPKRTWAVLNGNDRAAAFGPTKVPSFVARMDAVS
jgi:hypothetical protein